ncbi:cytochrome o ubiquinol oxidase subunit I [Candidatus Neptunochlamydia vexilliferae]|uniref:Cytochrome bo(3) ubiquinol oxidase subunit 1 n=1 Tax=Candidatus Neptunichlamydia vexilliferae TaxID=1651774 RepID=A0ABS0AXH8_9BACT|nr:cytochrome o ubiquinol oxidase subunit I [Candidatus Neptunochlamydia vexilliferae]MBF5058828.1 Cytochrome bo(3) ubiquinol oxidase subunit 1 [Candidatus Neptunochlamydia vexilliferae]
MLGRLTQEALKHDWIEYAAGASMFLGAILVLALITYYKKWTWLWKEWLTSVDHKKIGIMYIVVSAIMLLKGLIDAVMMRAQQAIATGDSMGYLGAEHFQQIFTAHGVTMIFFVGMGVVFGIINLVLPMQIGARDVAFPFLNSLSFWLFTAGGLYILISLVIGVFAGTGWTAYPPLSGLKYNPGVGVDYWLWSIQISGVGSMLSGINFLVTTLKMRCPGMTLKRMPVFVWSTLVMMTLVIFAFPILTATIGMLSTDRLLDTKLFTAGFGGSPMMYINLIWAWGHPEVYILVLPAFGIFSEIVPVFSHKRLFGYMSMVWALGAITFLSFIVWLHHFFTMGAGANVNAFFGIMTIIIAIPTGVKVFNWLFTMYRGRVQFSTPMLWFMGFIVVFVTGGMTGVMLAIPGIDFQAHNSLFLIAHFHSVIIGGVVFAFFAGYTYWFPKFIGFKLNEKLGRYAFWCWLIGFLVAFMPLYLLGFMGATRRMNYYPAETGWQPLFIVAALGALLIAVGVFFQVLQLYVSIKKREEYKKGAKDPWNGRNLEWSTSSPPPFYNYAITPEVETRDSFWEAKHGGKPLVKGEYQEIHMPKNTAIGFLIGAISCVLGFALVWHMFAIAAVCALGILGCLIVRLFEKHTDYYVTVDEIKKIEGGAS